MNPLQRIRVADIELAYRERGGGRTLLLVHGFPLDHRMWQAQLDDLSDACRVIAPDLRGFGESGPAGETLTMEQLADDLAGLLDALQISEPVVLCGLSMGGYVAWQFVRRYRERLAGLILCDTRAVGDTAEARANRLKMADEVQQRGTKFVAEAMLPKLFSPHTAEHVPEALEYADETILATDARTIAAAQRGMAARPDVTAELPSYDVPALVVVGQYDEISPVAEMRTIADALPNAELVVVPDAGHMAPLENPSAVHSAIRGFFARLD